MASIGLTAAPSQGEPGDFLPKVPHSAAQSIQHAKPLKFAEFTKGLHRSGGPEKWYCSISAIWAY